MWKNWLPLKDHRPIDEVLPAPLEKSGNLIWYGEWSPWGCLCVVVLHRMLIKNAFYLHFSYPNLRWKLILCQKVVFVVARQSIHMITRCNYNSLLLALTKEEVNAIVRDAYLSVCLLANLLKNATCMDLDDILRVDRRRDMDELVNFWARFGS